MSSTHMDFSPSRIDRQQDIASWPEENVSGLKAREQSRYRKRKAAIIEYFQSDASAEEISAKHNLPAKDSLEKLARRCLMLHEDGQVWGLRALVPGARVIDQRALTAEEGASTIPVSEETGEVAAVTLMKAMALPETPAPTTSEEVEQEDFPPGVEHAIPEPEEIEQEDFPASTESIISEPEEVEQADFPVSEKNERSVDEEVEQEDFSSVADTDESVPEDSLVIEDVEESTAKLVNEESATEAVTDTEEATAKLENDTTVAEIVEEIEEPTEKLADEATVAEIAENSEEADSSNNAELSSANEALPLASPDLTGDVVTSLSEVVNVVADAEQIEEEHEAQGSDSVNVASPLARDAAPERVEVAELDTVEVAQVMPTERHEDVADAETIEVPTATLAKLAEAERVANLAETETTETASAVAEQEIGDLAETETVETASVATEQTIAETAETVETSLVAVDEKTVEVAEDDTATGWSKDVMAVIAVMSNELSHYSQPLDEIESQNELAHPFLGSGRYQITGSQAALKRALFRRWNKLKQQKQHRRWVKIVSAAVIVSILVGLAIPLVVGLIGYSTYDNIKGVAYDGINNLMAIKELIPANKNDLLSALNPQKLTDAQNKLSKAESDFLQLQATVNRPDIHSLLQQWAPEYSDKLDMARHLVQVALDVSQMGQELIGVAQIGSNIVHGGALLSTSATTPLLTASEVNIAQAALIHAQYYISDIQTQMNQVNLAQMPFGTTAQKAEIAKYLNDIPQAESTISQVQGLVGPVAWLLGVGSPRNFLVQTLDRGELRPSGGFEGQYGVLTLNGGRMSPFTLKDITLLDYASNGNEFGNHPPAQYSWMDFGYFGVRDANLSADYPTTARMVMQLFQAEGGGPVDGDIQITPVVIEQFLQLTGPLTISQYHDTVTAQNLEQKLHAYQQDPRLIAVQKQVTDTNTHESRKAFTALVGSMLLDRAKHLKMTQLMDFGKILFQDLKSRDLQVYFNNPVAEQWLQQNDDSGSMPSFTNGVDGFMVVQANISISKAAQYVQSTFNDQVTLDGSGGATHNLTITLDYNQTGPVYGFNTYADYLRVYAPANAQYRGGYGFETGRTLCTSTTKAPPSNNNGGKNPTPTPTPTPPPGGGNGGNGGQNTDATGSYSDIFSIYGCSSFYHTSPDTDYRYCRNGNYELGYDGMISKPWPIQELGGPKEMGSDLPGYSMWGGMTLTPKNCTSKITLEWYVPNVVRHTPGQSPYQMVVGHQAGWPDNVQVSVNASAQKGLANFSFNNSIDDDTLIAMPALPKPKPPKSTPTPTATPGGKKKK